MPAAIARNRPGATKGIKIGDDAVLAKTGRNWKQWFSLIDAAGGKAMNHKEIVAVVAGHGIPPWWGQMVTVGYEQARGLRKKHETPAGYQVSASKTIAASADGIFRAWSEPRRRSKWLPEGAGMVIRKSTPSKSLRLTCGDGATHVDVNLYAKGDRKCQVAVEHRKLPNARAAARMKRHWSAALDRLAAEMG